MGSILVFLAFLVFPGTPIEGAPTCDDGAEELIRPTSSRSFHGMLDEFFGSRDEVLVIQEKEWGEILGDYETENRYNITDAALHRIGFAAELSGRGFWDTLKRQNFGNRRPMEIVVLNENREEILRLKRPFYWFFSSMEVSSQGEVLGSIHRRRTFLSKYGGPRPFLFSIPVEKRQVKYQKVVGTSHGGHQRCG